MVVSSPVPINLAATEVALDHLQDMSATSALDNREHWLQLPSPAHLAVALDGTAEAAFTINEADDPLLESWPFLLIDRTGHIVTSTVDGTLRRTTDNFGSAGYSVFPAYSQLQLRDHSRNGQTRGA